MSLNLDIIKRHYAASAAGDLAGMLADVADDVRWTEMAGFPCAGSWTGRQQIISNVFQLLARDWINYRFELERLYDAGDSIIASGEYAGVFRATGKTMRARVVHIWQLEDGKIRAFEQFTDTLLVRQAMATD